jgi:hypothetical protein
MPVCADSDASRYFLDDAATPPLGPSGRLRRFGNIFDRFADDSCDATRL